MAYPPMDQRQPRPRPVAPVSPGQPGMPLQTPPPPPAGMLAPDATPNAAFTPPPMGNAQGGMVRHDQRPGSSATPAPVAPGYSPTQFQSWAQGRYGVGPDVVQQYMPQIGAHVGAPAGPGGRYSQQQWTQAQTFADTLARQRGWQGPAGGGSAPAPPPQTPTPPATPTQPNLQEQLSQLVSSQLGQQPGNVTADPIYQQQTNAFNVANQRATDRQRAALAERAGATGTLQSGGFNSQVSNLLERQGERETGFAAQLAGQHLDRQQEQLQNAMSMALAIGNQDLARQIEQRMAANEQARIGLSQQGLNLQGELGRGDLDLRRYLGRGQLGLGLLGTLLGNEQANNRLGFDYTQLQALMNRSAIMDLLNGGAI